MATAKETQPTKLTASQLKKKVDDKGVDELLSYCKKPIYENTLIFYTYDNDFKKVLKAFKDISTNADVYVVIIA